MSRLSTDLQEVNGGGLRVEMQPAGQGRFPTSASEHDAPPPAPVFELPPTGLVDLTGWTRAGVAAATTPFAGSGQGVGRFGTSPPEQDAPPPVFEPPPTGPDLQQLDLQQLLQGAGELASMFSAFAGTFSRPAIQQLLGSPEVKQLLASPEMQRLLASPDVKQLLANPEIQRLLNDPVIKQVLGNLTGMSNPAGAVGGVPVSPEARPAGHGRLSQGTGTLGTLLRGLMGMLSNPAIKQLLAMGTGMAQSAGYGIYDATLQEPHQSTPEVSTNELRRILEQNSALVFDNRTPLEYAIGHIPGALNVGPKPGVAMSLYVSDVAEIARIAPSKQAPIVVYCNGPFCGKSRRLGDELVAAGFTNVRRYQLGTPVWRALVGPMAMEPAGVQYVLESDHTAAFVDARSPSEFASGSLPSARNVPPGDVVAAKDDGRLPMDDFNTRVVVLGRDGAQAHSMAHTLVGQGFNNVKFFDGAFSKLISALR
jgi:rhodanese-related sulfurtransferase